MIPKIRHGRGFYRICRQFDLDYEDVISATVYSKCEVQDNTLLLPDDMTVALRAALTEAIAVRDTRSSGVGHSSYSDVRALPRSSARVRPSGRQSLPVGLDELGLTGTSADGGTAVKVPKITQGAADRSENQAGRQRRPKGAPDPKAPALQGEILSPIDVLERANDEIRSALGRLSGAVFAIGRCLAEVKAYLPHGNFQKWIDGECCLSRREAQRYLRVWEEFGTKSAILAHLGVTTLDRLAGRAVPPILREQIVGELMNDPACLDDKAVHRRLMASLVGRSSGQRGTGAPKREDRCVELSLGIFGVLAEKLTLAERRNLAGLFLYADVTFLIDLLLNGGAGLAEPSDRAADITDATQNIACLHAPQVR